MTSVRQLASKPTHEATCPACGHHVAVAFFTSEQPLATIAWPHSSEAARAMPMLPLEFVRCVDCGHVFNRAFDYAAVPYTDKPNLMFNKGALWSGFLSDMQTTLLSRLPERPVVVEIGHGDGSFIAALAAARPGGRYLGFDPNGAAIGDGAVELRAELFEPGRHLDELQPDLIISRHVMEHLANPLGFLQRLCFAVAHSGSDCLLYLEVPCIDRVLETGRTVDLYYEHNSQFTTKSFSRMLTRCAAVVETIGHGYDGEVIFGLARMSAPQDQVKIAEEAARYNAGTRIADQVIRSQLSALHSSGRSVAIWGGTGKSAAFMNRYRVDVTRFPIVIDSDAAKVGTFVPGMGQEIRGRDWLKKYPMDVVIIPPQWRAADIIVEMERAGIVVEAIVIEHGGRLIDYFDDPHPYHRMTRPAAWCSKLETSVDQAPTGADRSRARG
jgi:C-methyltransferase C-terminal domain/Methyltransferase domain